MITKEQALKNDYFHRGTCKLTIGPKGGMKLEIVTFRRTGKTKTWKTRPNDFMIPVKYGLYGPSTYITQDNAKDYHVVDDCSAIKMQQEFADT